ncbi:MAG: hypothetical protein ABUL50_11305, partial [Rhizobacter sp.]
MPTTSPRTRRLPLLATAVLASLACASTAALAADDASSRVDNSTLNAPLFNQLLISEIEVRDGALATGYQLMLDAARRTADEQLYRRATEIALQARSGDDALAAVRAWRQGLPGSTEALRYEIQLLVQLDRTADTVQPIQALIKLTAPAQRSSLINALPRFLARSKDRKLAANVLEQALLPYINEPEP